MAGGGRRPNLKFLLRQAVSFEFLLRQAAEPSEELCAKAHCELFKFELEEELQFIGEFINEQTVLT